MAGELCDGLHAHPFTSAKYLREFLLPHVEKGSRKPDARARTSNPTTAFVIVGRNADEIKAREAVRQQISFYASTRTYKMVLETHGWADVAQAQRDGGQGRLGRDGQSDHRRDARRVCGHRDLRKYRRKGVQRYDGLLDRVAFYIPYRAGADDARMGKTRKAIQRLSLAIAALDCHDLPNKEKTSMRNAMLKTMAAMAAVAALMLPSASRIAAAADAEPSAAAAPTPAVTLEMKEPGTRKFTLVSVEIDGTKFWLPSVIAVEQGDKVKLTLKNQVPSAARRIRTALRFRHTTSRRS